jgi:hypothetical protein
VSIRSVDVRIAGACLALCPLLVGCGTPAGEYGRGSGAIDPAVTAGDVAAHDTDSDDSSTGDAADSDDSEAGSTGGSTEGSTGAPEDTADTADALTFAGDVWPMFKARCSCHVGFPAGGLALNQGTAHVSLVGAQALEVDMDYVVPGDLDNSYLWLKLKGEQDSVGGSGVMMPQAGIPLIDPELDLVEQWILEGAVP